MVHVERRGRAREAPGGRGKRRGEEGGEEEEERRREEERKPERGRNGVRLARRNQAEGAAGDAIHHVGFQICGSAFPPCPSTD
jgi:hypothetical protein